MALLNKAMKYSNGKLGISCGKETEILLLQIRNEDVEWYKKFDGNINETPNFQKDGSTYICYELPVNCEIDKTTSVKVEGKTVVVVIGESIPVLDNWKTELMGKPILPLPQIVLDFFLSKKNLKSETLQVEPTKEKFIGFVEKQRENKIDAYFSSKILSRIQVLGLKFMSVKLYAGTPAYVRLELKLNEGRNEEIVMPLEDLFQWKKFNIAIASTFGIALPLQVGYEQWIKNINTLLQKAEKVEYSWEDVPDKMVEETIVEFLFQKNIISVEKEDFTTYIENLIEGTTVIFKFENKVYFRILSLLSHLKRCLPTIKWGTKQMAMILRNMGAVRTRVGGFSYWSMVVDKTKDKNNECN